MGVPKWPPIPLALAQGERRESEQRVARESPASLERVDERGRGRREAADQHPAARERGDAEARAITAPNPLRGVGREADAVELADDRDRCEVRARLCETESIEGGFVVSSRSRLGRRGPLPATACRAPNAGAAAQDEPIVEEPAIAIADRYRAVEHGEAPRFAERDPAGGKGVEEDETGRLGQIDVDRLPQGRARERNRVVGHPLDDRARPERDPHALESFLAL